jgi:hypothetical protein
MGKQIKRHFSLGGAEIAEKDGVLDANSRVK